MIMTQKIMGKHKKKTDSLSVEEIEIEPSKKKDREASFNTESLERSLERGTRQTS